MPTEENLKNVKTLIERLLRFLEKSDGYRNDRVLIESLSPSDEKLSALEGDSVGVLFQDYLNRYLLPTVEKTVMLGDFERHSRGTLKPLSADALTLIGDFLPTDTVKRISVTSTAMRGIFSSTANNCRYLLTSVVQGNLNEAMRMVTRDPGLVFEVAPHIKTPAGQTFYRISAYQMMTFLCDADMKDQVMAWVTPRMTLQMEAVRHAQYAAIDSGGADLVKLNRDPSQLPFSEVTTFRTDAVDLGGHPLTISLLENPNGLIFYNNGIYYANQTSQTVTPLSVTSEALDSVKPLFADMIDNSARRSSDEEYQLIQEVLRYPETDEPIKLTRKGIQYTREGKLYHDSRIEFRLLTAYRRYLELCGQARIDHNWDLVDQFWVKEIGGAQKEVMWLLQRFCEHGKPFHPPRDFNDSPFIRNFMVNEWSACTEVVPVFSHGCFHPHFGSKFAIGRMCSVDWGWVQYNCRDMTPPRADFAASLRLVNHAKKQVMELQSVVEPRQRRQI